MAAARRKRERELTKGALFPSLDDVMAITTKLKKDMQTNKKLAAAFKNDPRSILAAAGLNEDVQTELLTEAGLASRAIGCWFSCWQSCWFTGCACTNGTIVISA